MAALQTGSLNSFLSNRRGGRPARRPTGGADGMNVAMPRAAEPPHAPCRAGYWIYIQLREQQSVRASLQSRRRRLSAGPPLGAYSPSQMHRPAVTNFDTMRTSLRGSCDGCDPLPCRYHGFIHHRVRRDSHLCTHAASITRQRQRWRCNDSRAHRQRDGESPQTHRPLAAAAHCRPGFCSCRAFVVIRRVVGRRRRQRCHLRARFLHQACISISKFPCMRLIAQRTA